MNILKFIFISLFLVPFLAFAQNQAVLPKAGFTPESPFYFLDKFGEDLRTFFTFNSEGRARLQITFAAERISEIKAILETKGVEAPGLEIAQSRLQAHLASAVAILDSEKAKGKDVSQLASELDDKFEGPRSALEETFKTQKRSLESQEDALKAKIRDARRVGDTAQVEALVKQLAEVKTQKELLEQEEDDQEATLEKEEERIREEIEAKAKAEKKIRKAEQEKQEVLAEALEEGVAISAKAFNVFDDHIAKAKSAFEAGKFEEARNHAEEAKEILDKIEAAIDDLEEAKEEEEGEELKEEQEEKEREAIEKQDEKVRNDVKKEAERLEKGQKKTEEKASKTTEKNNEQTPKQEEIKNNKGEKGRNEESSSTRIPQVITVSMRPGRFDDNTVDLKRGDTVRWINKDTQPHWPASNPHPIHINLPGFDALRPINPGESYEFTFQQTGIFGYHDHLNPEVVGTVIVK